MKTARDGRTADEVLDAIGRIGEVHGLQTHMLSIGDQLEVTLDTSYPNGHFECDPFVRVVEESQGVPSYGTLKTRAKLEAVAAGVGNLYFKVDGRAHLLLRVSVQPIGRGSLSVVGGLRTNVSLP